MNYLGGCYVFTRIPVRARQECHNQGTCDDESRGLSDVLAGTEDGGRGPAADEWWQAETLGKVKKPLAPQRHMILPTP